jgi:hypothetical protein
MLHRIILQLVMSVGVSDFLTPGEKSSKCGRHIVINMCKRTHPFIWFSVKHWKFPLALDDHVVQYDHVRAGYQTMVKRACNTPNALSTSFLAASYI